MPEAALREFQRGLQLARDRSDLARVARCLNLIAASQIRLFQYRAALQSAQEALRRGTSNR